jgi:hypothetical protein
MQANPNCDELSKEIFHLNDSPHLRARFLDEVQILCLARHGREGERVWGQNENRFGRQSSLARSVRDRAQAGLGEEHTGKKTTEGKVAWVQNAITKHVIQNGISGHVVHHTTKAMGHKKAHQMKAAARA